MWSVASGPERVCWCEPDGAVAGMEQGELLPGQHLGEKHLQLDNSANLICNWQERINVKPLNVISGSAARRTRDRQISTQRCTESRMSCFGLCRVFTNVSHSWHELSATQEIWFSATSSALGPQGNPKATSGFSFPSLQAKMLPCNPRS